MKRFLCAWVVIVVLSNTSYVFPGDMKKIHRKSLAYMRLAGDDTNGKIETILLQNPTGRSRIYCSVCHIAPCLSDRRESKH